MTADEESAAGEAPPTRSDAAGHVQDAVLAMVAAARAALDVVEKLASDPGPLLDAAARAAEAGRTAAGSWVSGPGDPQAATGGDQAPSDPEPPGPERAPRPTRRPRVQHIRVESSDD